MLLMLSAYVLPLWKITLEAPQYPEGLHMDIGLFGITGNVSQINGLNHYIGMKHINPEDFVEFKILPYVFGLIILTGVIVVISGNRKLLTGLFIIMIVFAMAGFIDFYLWEYNYGHNLDPHAAIRIEGMYYQPPLIGYKQLLNFLAGSFPATGGVLVGIAGVITAWVLFTETRFYKKR
jgi:copper chaperone NosL